MASGRIQPGSRQWVEAMRRLSGTEDPTVDMSMGRKVSRDAAIPHRMGSEALDTRLRGGGGGGGPDPDPEPFPTFDGRDAASLPVGRNSSQAGEGRAELNAYRMTEVGGVPVLEGNFSTNWTVRSALNAAGVLWESQSGGDTQFFFPLGVPSGQDGSMLFRDERGVTVTEILVADQDLLTTQVTPSSAVRIRPAGATEFRAFIVDLQVTFASVAVMRAMGPMGQTTAWAEGQRMPTDAGPVHWDGSDWQDGIAPAPAPFEFYRGQITRFVGARQGWVEFTGGQTPLTTDAPPDWNTRITAGARMVTWDNFAMPLDAPVLMTVTDAAGQSVQVTFDYTGLESGQSGPVTEAP
jgi:hypothetical protein